MPQTKKKTDAEIQLGMIRELKWDPRVEETEVGVEVDNGIVTLTGTVTSWTKRFTPGVRVVNDNLTVDPYA